MSSPAQVALAVIAGTVGLGALIGFCARGRHRMDLEQWTVGGRQFGLLIVWLLMAGEGYTTFALLGASGWAYSRGGPALYAVAFLTLGNIIAFFLRPLIWELGRDHRLQTQADFFQLIYRHRTLSAAVAALGIAAMVPYLQLQLTGLGIIVETASFGAIPARAATALAALLIAGFVFANGIRAVAGISILKDVLMIGTVVVVGFTIPRLLFGGVAPMFARLSATLPAHLTMPGETADLGHGWFISMVLLSSCGQVTWPHGFSSAFAAKDGETLRRNAILMPLCTLTIPLVFFAGYAARLTLPPLKNGDLAFMAIVRAHFPAWFLGLVGGGGALAAMVPAAIMLLTAATLFAKNLVRPLLAPDLPDSGVAALSRGLVAVLTAVSLWFAWHSSTTLVALLQLGYGMVAQFLPGVLFGLGWKRVRGGAVLAGLAAALICLVILVETGRDPWGGIAAGFIALAVNFLLVTGLTLARSPLPRHSPPAPRPA